jgi:hypothetical protein
MNERDYAIMRYQNDPLFHALVDSFVTMLERGTIDRNAIIDALQVAEIIQYQRERDIPADPAAA